MRRKFRENIKYRVDQVCSNLISRFFSVEKYDKTLSRSKIFREINS